MLMMWCIQCDTCLIVYNIYGFVKNIILKLFTFLGILGLLGLHFLNLLCYLSITHSLSINKDICIHSQYQYNIEEI
jgi:arginine exporter protein ArgO